MQVAGLFDGGRSEGASGWVVQWTGGESLWRGGAHTHNWWALFHTTLLRGHPGQRCGVDGPMDGSLASNVTQTSTVCMAPLHTHHIVLCGGRCGVE